MKEDKDRLMEGLWMLYEAEGAPRNISIGQFCMENNVNYNEFYKWYKSMHHVEFPDAEPNQTFEMKVKPIDKHSVAVFGFRGEGITDTRIWKVSLNDTVKLPVGRVVVAPTLYYTNEYYDVPFTVRKNDRDNVALGLNGGLQAALASKTATIINLTIHDQSIARAEDILNTLISVYNESVISDKNQVMVNTSNFINERLIIIEKELGNVDSDIESYKRENQLTDIVSETGMYLQQTTDFGKEGLSLENQLALAKYIRDYLTTPSKESDLIPANTGISAADANLETQIENYNTMLLKRDRLISSSSDRNPVVMDLNKSIQAMRQTIIRSMDNLIVSLNIQTKNVQARSAQTTRRISEVPGQQKHAKEVSLPIVCSSENSAASLAS